jgi:hypothetical protein
VIRLDHIKFKEDFKKLNDETFTTIRLKSKRVKSNAVYRIVTPTRSFKVLVVNQSKPIRVCEIPPHILLEDTGTETLEEAFKVLQGFYKDLTLLDEVKIIYLKRIGRNL